MIRLGMEWDQTNDPVDRDHSQYVFGLVNHIVEVMEETCKSTVDEIVRLTEIGKDQRYSHSTTDT